MSIFEIYNATRRTHATVARLFCNEKTGELRIVIDEQVTPGDLPLMLALFAEEGTREIDDKWARAWVQERIPPQGRQNLGEILRAQGLERYDEMALLEATHGRSAQDDFLIRKVPDTDIEHAMVSLDESKAKQRNAQNIPNVHSPQPSPNAACAAIGPAIAAKRKQLGMTQRDLAEHTGIDQAAISRIEAGKANPTLSTLDALAAGVDACLYVGLR